MADLALRLKIFIASPSDVLAERDVAEREILALQEGCAEQLLLVQPYRWEDQVTPTYRDVQLGITGHLRDAELTIAILWSTLGSVAESGETGTQTELRVAGHRATRGFADDLFLYFKTSPPPDGAENGARNVRRFCEKIRAGGVFTVDFESTADFRDRLRQDLERWVARWHGVPRICAFALNQMPGGGIAPDLQGENRLTILRREFDLSLENRTASALGKAAISQYQDHGPEISVAPLGEYLERHGVGEGNGTDLNRFTQKRVLVSSAEGLHFGHRELFFYFCARGLIDAVAAGDVGAVERRQYVNPIHQYLRALAVGKRRQALIPTLRGWLLNVDGVTEGRPVARNFAAYVLGMLDAAEAQQDLAQAIDEDLGEDVQTYCVMSLGRMRARAQMPSLVDLYSRTDNPDLRLVVAQAVSRMVGIASYPL